MTQRKEKMDDVTEKIEQDFDLIRSTAIKDKQQDDVGNIIRNIKSARVKLRVLTGDKIETTINIGFSCKLLDREMEIFVLNKETTNELYQ